MVYKSIFDRITNYKSNPIDEYNKILNYIENVSFSYDIYLMPLLKDAYLYCEEFKYVYPTLDELLDANCFNIQKYSSPAREYYDSFTSEKKEELLNEFLTYCQVILVLIFIFRENKIEISNYNPHIDPGNKETDYCLKLITNSLKLFNYKFIKKEDKNIIDILIDDPIAESVAALSPLNISESIITYLGSRDTKTKENALHNFIDFLEPTFKKYNDPALIKKIREYVQLIRHPETKKDLPEYSWFFTNKIKYLDEMFTLCLFVQQYEISKNIITNFERNKNK